MEQHDFQRLCAYLEQAPDWTLSQDKTRYVKQGWGYIVETILIDRRDHSLIHDRDGKLWEISDYMELMHRLNALQTEIGVCLVIRCPHWFERQDFQVWRRDSHGVATIETGTLWSQIRARLRRLWQQSVAPVCQLDTFLSFDSVYREDPDNQFNNEYGGLYRWDSAGASRLPKDIYQEIGRFLYESNARWGVVVIKNSILQSASKELQK